MTKSVKSKGIPRRVASSSKLKVKVAGHRIDMFQRFYDVARKGRGAGETADDAINISSDEDENADDIGNQGEATREDDVVDLSEEVEDRMLEDSGFFETQPSEPEASTSRASIPMKRVIEEEHRVAYSKNRRVKQKAVLPTPKFDAKKLEMFADTITDDLSERLQAFKATVEGSTRERVAKYQIFHSRRPLDDDKLWDHILQGSGADFFNTVFAGHPLQIDLMGMEQRGVIARDEIRQPHTQSTYYIRSLSGNREQVSNLLKAFMSKHPAESAWCIQHMASIHVPYSEIKQATHRAFLPLGLEGAAVLVLDTVTEEYLAPFYEIPVDGSRGFAIPYIGMGIVNSPEERLDRDASMSYGQSRETNILKLIDQHGVESETYHIIPLDYPVRSVLDFRSLPIVGWIEQAGIASLRRFGTNSAPGGERSEFVPAKRLQAIGDACISHTHPSPDVQSIITLSATVGRQLGRFLVDERSFWDIVSRSESRMSDKGFETITFAAGAGNAPRTVEVNGITRIPRVMVLSDTTREIQKGRIGAFSSDTASKSLLLDRHIRTSVTKDLPPFGDIDFPTFDHFFGPYIDLFRFFPGFSNSKLNLLFFKRLLHCCNPLMLSSWSSVVLAFLLSGDLPNLYEEIGDIQMRSDFVSGRASRNIADLFESDTTVPSISPDTYFEHIGRIYLLQFGMGENDWCLYIPMQHYGVDKHDPALSNAFCRVQFLSQVSIEVLTNIVLRNAALPDIRRKPTREFLRICRDEGEKILFDNGWTESMENCKLALDRLRKGIQGLRWKSPIRKDRAPFDMPPRNQLLAEPKEDGARLRQYWKLMDDDKERIEQGVLKKIIKWKPTFMNDAEAFDWFMNLKDGKNVVLSAASRGRTLEGQERARASQLALAQFNHENPHRRIDADPETGLTLNETEEKRRYKEKVVECIKELVNPTRTIPQGINDSWRVAYCAECDRIALGNHSTSKHHCGPNQMMVTYENFPDLTRLIYPHDLLRDPHFSEYFEGFDCTSNDHHILPGTSIVLIPLSARMILLRNRNKIPPAAYDNIGDEQLIWVQEKHAQNEDWLLTMAFDLVIPQISEAPMDFVPFQAEDKMKLWYGVASTKIEKILSGSSNKQLMLARCDYGYCGVQVVYTKARNPEKRMQHACELNANTEKRLCGTVKISKVTKYLDLPALNLRVLWIKERKEGTLLHEWKLNH